MKSKAFVFFAMLAGGVCAAPTITGVNVSQEGNRKVTVSYRLSEPAIVQAEFFDGETSLGDEPLRDGFAGDVFMPVAAGERTFTWKPRKAWRDHEYANFKVKLTPTAVSDAPEWMVIDLVNGGGARYYDRESLLLGGSHSNAAYKSTHLLLKRIPAAGIPWRMGSATHDKFCGSRAIPHLVTLTEDFYLGVYQVTQDQVRQWNANWSFHFSGPGDLPAEKISYEDCRGATAGHNWPKDGHAVDDESFIGFLRGKCGQEVDLPTDAQWEYAARGGSSRQLFNGMMSNEALAEIAWYDKNSSNDVECTSHPVGLKKVNPFGLYDVAGNVTEYCLDWCQDKLPTDNAVDPVGPTGSDELAANGYCTAVTLSDGSVVQTGRIIRGGAASWTETFAQHAYRNYFGVRTRDSRGGLRVYAPGLPAVKE